MIDLPPVPDIWLPPRPAIVRPADERREAFEASMMAVILARRRRAAVVEGVETLVTPTNMTSDTAPTPFVTSTDDSNAGFLPYKACDGSDGTSFLSQTSAAAVYWQIDLGAAYKAFKYAITEIDASQWSSGVRHPDTWTFRGSNDAFASEDVELDVRSGVSPVAANDRKEYSFSNPTAYRYYRIAMGSAGPGNLLGFATFEIYALV